MISKTKNFLQFYFVFLKFKLNFGHFLKNDDPHSLFISQATASQKRRSIYVYKSRFRLLFQKEQGKRLSTLLKSDRQIRSIFIAQREGNLLPKTHF